MTSTRRWNYFSDREVEKLEPEFVALLDRARHIAGTPFVITSGYRTDERNASVGGVQHSAHTKGLAVDLRCGDSRTLYQILRGLLEVNLNRIGIYFRLSQDNVVPVHIHVDFDRTKAPEVVWLNVES